MKKRLSPLLLPAALAVALLAGCADMSGIAPQARMRDAATLGLAAPDPAAEAPPDWWRGFHDAQLDALVAQALQGNPSLGQQIQASAATKVKGVASGGVGLIVGRDLVTGSVDVLFL